MLLAVRDKRHKLSEPQFLTCRMGVILERTTQEQ